MLFVVLSVQPIITDAVSGSEFQAGHIMDDGVFFNGSSMAPSDIQTFLNSKVPTCDTNGTQPSGHAGYTRAEWGAANGYPAPYTCLKDYRQDTQAKSAETGLCNGLAAGNRSAAEIIYEVGRSCGISQAVLVVLLQKEQSLVTDDWPWSIQYRSATGYGCPDTAPCDADYYGFFNQVYNAARQFKRYARDESLFQYRAFRTNTIQYNLDANCGSSGVYIQNQATAGLYNYTPYQPNAATLVAAPGQTVSCGAYGNLNFWRYYNDWFGPTFNGEYLWRVIRTAGDGRLFLQVGNTKRWIPTGDIYYDWTLDSYPIIVLDDPSFNAIPTIPELTRLGTTGQYNYVVDSGIKHYLPNNYTALWGYQNIIAAPVSALLRTIPEHEPMGRFIKTPEANSTFSYWVVDGGTRHAINPADLGAWGENASNLVGISQSYLAYIPIGDPLVRYISSSGTFYVVDQGSLIRMPDNVTASSWQQSPYVPAPSAASFLPVRATASFLVKASDSNNWYMLDAGNKYYIQSGDTAANWGLSSSNLIVVSPDFLAQFAPASINLTNFAKDSASQQVYVLDGQKHYVINGTLLSTLTTSASNIITTSTARLGKLPLGADYSTPLVQLKGTPHAYLFDQGARYYISSGALFNAFNVTGGSIALSGTLVNQIPYSAEQLKSVFKDSAGSYYLADNAKKVPLSSSVQDAWQSTTNPVLSDNLMSLFGSGQPTINSRYLRTQSSTYLVNNGTKTYIVSSMLPSYIGSSDGYNQVNDTVPTQGGVASYLLRSSDDQKTWFINQGTKAEVNFAKQVTLGYLTTSLQPAAVSSAFLAAFPTSTQTSLLIRKQSNSGVKFLNFGSSLGFPNGDTLNNSVSSNNPIIVVDDGIYDNFPLVGSITRIIKDDSGKLYLLESGQRRWITNGAAYRPYANIPITYLYGTTMALIPEGPAIN